MVLVSNPMYIIYQRQFLTHHVKLLIDADRIVSAQIYLIALSDAIITALHHHYHQQEYN
jgi:hypothetical protein